MFEHSGKEVRVAIRLNEELADWAGGIVRFAPTPGPPAEDEAVWYRAWLAGAPDRWLIYVVRDFDTAQEYWKSVAEGPVAAADPVRKAEAEENRDRAADWVDRLPKKPKPAAGPAEWFDSGYRMGAATCLQESGRALVQWRRRRVGLSRRSTSRSRWASAGFCCTATTSRSSWIRRWAVGGHS